VGLFKKKNKNTAAVAANDGELIAVLSASVAAKDEELIAVLSAAVAASDESERIAVIAAALAAYEDGGAVSGLRVSKINRTAGAIPAWGVMGNREQIDTRRF
jgi:outer membrane receptor protein involved in Fe transport